MVLTFFSNAHEPYTLNKEYVEILDSAVDT